MHLTVDIYYSDAGKWQENKHPRGQPKNKGEFVKSKEAGPAKSKPAIAKPATPTAKPAGPIQQQKGAKQFANINNPGAAEAIPSLSKEFWGRFDKAVRKSVLSYIEGDFDEINDYLRGDIDEIDPDVAEEIEDIQAAFKQPGARLKADVLLWRLDQVSAEALPRWSAALAKGQKPLVYKEGFVSTSLTDSPDLSKLGPVKVLGEKRVNIAYQITAKAGTPALGLGGLARLQVHKAENEVLLRHEQQFEVTGIRKVGGKTIISLTTVIKGSAR